MADDTMHLFQADQSRRKLVEGGKMRSGSLEAFAKPAEAAKPCQRAFHYVSDFAQSAAMASIICQRNQSQNATGHQGQDHLAVAKAPIALRDQRFVPEHSLSVRQRTKLINKCQGMLVVAMVRRRHEDQKRKAMNIRQDCPLAAVFGPVRAAGAGVRPPKTARKEAVSMITCR